MAILYLTPAYFKGSQERKEGTNQNPPFNAPFCNIFQLSNIFQLIWSYFFINWTTLAESSITMLRI